MRKRNLSSSCGKTVHVYNEERWLFQASLFSRAYLLTFYIFLISFPLISPQFRDLFIFISFVFFTSYHHCFLTATFLKPFSTDRKIQTFLIFSLFIFRSLFWWNQSRYRKILFWSGRYPQSTRVRICGNSYLLGKFRYPAVCTKKPHEFGRQNPSPHSRARKR